MEELKVTFPKLEFRSVGVSFSPGVKYLDKIAEATKDLEIKIVFNNAGFIVTGFMDQAPLGKLLANIECNATASVNITHYFLGHMVKNKWKGCVVFTSSVAGFIPTPFAAMYAATKAFVSQMACSLHIEVQNLGIDVCAVHPSPVASNFYDKVDHKIELMEAAQKSAVPPQDLPNEIFRSIGACALRDLGGTNIFFFVSLFFNSKYISFLYYIAFLFGILFIILKEWLGQLVWEHSSYHSTSSLNYSPSQHHTFLITRSTISLVSKNKQIVCYSFDFVKWILSYMGGYI